MKNGECYSIRVIDVTISDDYVGQSYINFRHCECMKKGKYFSIDDIGKSQ
jgi:hypothetical protein